MTAYQYLRNRISELGNHGRKVVLLRRWRMWTICIIKEVRK